MSEVQYESMLCDPSNLWMEPFGLHCGDILRSLPPGPDNAAIFQDYIEHHLRGMNYVVDREVPCLKMSGRRGRIDLVASYSFEHRGRDYKVRIGIELDWKRPRYRSLAKLRIFDGYRIIVLRRNDEYPYPIAGIDDIVCVPISAPLPTFLAGQAAMHP
jgi:hypothetical protein